MSVQATESAAVTSADFETFDTHNETTEYSDAKYEGTVATSGLDTFADPDVKEEKVVEQKREAKNDKNNEVQEQDETFGEKGKKSEEKVAKSDEKSDEGSDKEKEAKDADREAEAKTTEPAKTERQQRTLKLKNGDEEVKISVEAEIPVKINGEVQMVKVSDLRDNYSGAQAWDKKFSELSSEKKEIETQVDQFVDNWKKLQTDVNSFNHERKADELFDHEETLKKALDFLKLPSDTIDKVRDAFFSDFERMLEMSESERRAYLFERENARLKNRESLRLKSEEEQAGLAELRKQVDTAREAAGISEEAFAKAYDELAQASDGGQVEWQEAVQYAKTAPFIDKAESLIESVQEGLSENHDLVAQITESLVSGALSDDEVISLLKSELGQPSEEEKALTEKLGSEREVTTDTKASKVTQSPGGFESFDDFDDY